MRREGEVLIAHVMSAKRKVVLCAPFVKSGVLRRLLAAINTEVEVDVVTRWNAKEVAAGVSDLAVFDLVASRPKTKLYLLDNLHAKLYLADDLPLTGSANLTAKALGWCKNANIELLVVLPKDDESVKNCLVALISARSATPEERQQIQASVDLMDCVTLPESEPDVEGLSGFWLPSLAAPEKLYSAYLSSTRARLTSPVLKAADHDLAALGISPNLTEPAFKEHVIQAFLSMAAIKRILFAIQEDLTDLAAANLLAEFSDGIEITHVARWRILKDWLTHFFPEKYEVAPHSFVTRVRAGVRSE